MADHGNDRLPQNVIAQLAAHPSPEDDRYWVLDSLLIETEVIIAQNRRYFSRSCRNRLNYRFRELHARAAGQEEWFREVFGRPSLPDELLLLSHRTDGDHALSGYQLYELLVGWVVGDGPFTFRDWPIQFELARLVPMIVEYCGYRRHFAPDVLRYLEGLRNGPPRGGGRPPFEEMMAGGIGVGYPLEQREGLVWVRYLEDGFRTLMNHWRGYTGPWLPVFRGRERPAHQPRPVPILEPLEPLPVRNVDPGQGAVPAPGTPRNAFRLDPPVVANPPIIQPIILPANGRIHFAAPGPANQAGREPEEDAAALRARLEIAFTVHLPNPQAPATDAENGGGGRRHGGRARDFGGRKRRR